MFKTITLIVPLNVPLLIIPELISRIPALTSKCKQYNNTNNLNSVDEVYTYQEPILIVNNKEQNTSEDCRNSLIIHPVNIEIPTGTSSKVILSTTTPAKKANSASDFTSNQYNKENSQNNKYNTVKNTSQICKTGLTISMPNLTKDLIQISPDSNLDTRISSEPAIKVTNNNNTNQQQVSIQIEHSAIVKTDVVKADKIQPNPTPPMCNHYLEPFPWLKYINLNTTLLGVLLMTALLVGMHFIHDQYGILVYLFYGGRKLCRLFAMLWLTMSREIMKSTNTKIAQWWNAMMASESCCLSPIQFLVGFCD